MMSLLHPAMTAFLAVARHGTVHGAAREIGLSQTGVTQRVRGLERDLGCTLFVRSRKGMRPTAEGEALLRYGQRATDLEGELLSLIRRGADVADVRIAITGPSSLMRSRVIPGVAGVLPQFPGLALTFHLDDRDSALNQLKTGVAQLAVLARDDVVNELDAKRLNPIACCWSAPPTGRGGSCPPSSATSASSTSTPPTTPPSPSCAGTGFWRTSAAAAATWSTTRTPWPPWWPRVSATRSCRPMSPRRGWPRVD